MDSKEVVKITKDCARKYADSLGLEVDEESFDKMEQYLDSENNVVFSGNSEVIIDTSVYPNKLAEEKEQ